MLGRDENFGCLFGFINGAVVNKSILYFLVQKCRTEYLEKHSHAWLVRLQNMLDIVEFESILDFHPLDAHSEGREHMFYIVCRYHLY